MKSMHYLQNMGFKKRIFHLLLLLIMFSSSFTSCKKNKWECIVNAYSLKETWSITPQRDSINIGDTLIFSSSFSNNPFDYNTNKTVNFYGNALIGTSFSIRVIKGYNDLKPALDSFFLFLLEGEYKENDIKPTQIKDIFWTESNNKYMIKIGLVALKKGDYSITVTDAIGRLNKVNECESAAGVVLSNNNTKNNAYLSYPYYGLTYIPGNDSSHIFCIKIK